MKETIDNSIIQRNLALWSKNISNCITEIPQDINLTLSSGTLTLKAGSKVYVPNGSGVFDAVTISNDVSRSNFGTLNGKFFIGLRLSNNRTSFALGPYAESATTSGTTPPVSDGLFYNTNTNKINYYLNGVAENYECSFNTALVTISSGTVTSIDQVFNGFGYIGSTIFVLPNVKFLVPNGRNNDGTLKSISYYYKTLKTVNCSSTGNRLLALGSSAIYDITQTTWIYDEHLNRFRNAGGTSFSLHCVGANFTTSSGIITSFNPKTDFHALDWNDLENGNHFISVVESYVNGDNWYRIWADGWIEQGGKINVAADHTVVTFLKPFSNANYTITASPDGNTNVININHSNNNTNATADFDMASLATGYCKWYACGY